MRFLATLFAATLLAACNSTGNDPGPGGVTQREAEALDAAAEKLDAEAKVPESKAAEQAAQTPVKE
jgi:hypothetical protein